MYSIVGIVGYQVESTLEHGVVVFCCICGTACGNPRVFAPAGKIRTAESARYIRTVSDPNITGTFGGSLISFWLRSNWITSGGTVDDANGYYTMSIGALTSLANNADNTAHRTVATTIDNTAVTPNGITIDASHSSGVYSKSATVQPRAMITQYLIKY